MKDFSIIAIAGLAVLTVTAASAFSQAATNTQTGTEIVGEVGGPEIEDGTASGFTLDTVDPNEPFGDLDVDPTALGVEAGLTVAERAELKGRCAVVVANQNHYEAMIGNFCSSYVAGTTN